MPYIREWLSGRNPRPKLMVEPFAGGGIISLTVAAEELADTVLMVELDENVACVWQTVLNGSGDWLASRITDFEFTSENVKTELAKDAVSTAEKAFCTLLRNRVSRGGLLAPGAGLIKNGENGKGLSSRWYPVTLKKRIEAIIEVKDRISFVNEDGLSVLKRHAKSKDTVFFIDPPYTAASRNRFYTLADIDHDKLFRIACGLAGDFLMMYDKTDTVYKLAWKYNLDVEPITMRNTRNIRMDELLIGRDLSWLRRESQIIGGFNIDPSLF